MTLLVTGGTGFVMSVLARQWLERDPAARAVILDRANLDRLAERYFAPVRDRLTVIAADISTPTPGPRRSMRRTSRQSFTAPRSRRSPAARPRRPSGSPKPRRRTGSSRST